MIRLQLNLLWPKYPSKSVWRRHGSLLRVKPSRTTQTTAKLLFIMMMTSSSKTWRWNRGRRRCHTLVSAARSRFQMANMIGADDNIVETVMPKLRQAEECQGSGPEDEAEPISAYFLSFFFTWFKCLISLWKLFQKNQLWKTKVHTLWIFKRSAKFLSTLQWADQKVRW